MIVAKKKKIFYARAVKGLSQRKLAELIKVNPASICLIEKRKMGSRPETAKKICDVLDVKFDDIFEIADQLDVV